MIISNSFRYVTGILILFLFTGLLSGCASYTNHPDDDWWATDKVAHFAASAIIGVDTSVVAHQEGASTAKAFGIGVSLSMLAGVAKELFDQHIRHTYWSWKDMFWDLAGAVTGSAAGANCCDDH